MLQLHFWWFQQSCKSLHLNSSYCNITTVLKKAMCNPLSSHIDCKFLKALRRAPYPLIELLSMSCFCLGSGDWTISRTFIVLKIRSYEARDAVDVCWRLTSGSSMCISSSLFRLFNPVTDFLLSQANLYLSSIVDVLFFSAVLFPGSKKTIS